MDDEYRVDFEHYDIGPIHYKGNRRCLYDPIREILIFETPEEIIRQKFIRFLMDELKVPRSMIKVEVPLSNFSDGNKERADIVVYAERYPDEIRPVIVVECKAPQVSLTENVLYQVLNYDKILKTDMVIVTNGIDTAACYYVNDEEGYRLVQDLPTYHKLLDGKVNLDPPGMVYRTWRRPPFDELLLQENIKVYTDSGWIGEGTDKTLYPLIMNFAGLFNDSEVKLLPNNIEGLNIIEEGIKYVTYGNVGGGGYTSDYKFFTIEDEKGNIFSISLGIIGEGSIINDPKWGTRLGTTTLIVGTDFYGKDHSSLQLCLDRFTRIVEDNFELWHDGRLTVGNLGSVKRDEVIQFIKSREPSLVDQHNRIILGNFNRNIEMSWEQYNTRSFFYNLIKYAILRDEFRTIKVKRQHKKNRRSKSSKTGKS